MDEQALALDAIALGSESELHGVLCGLMSSGRQPASWCDAVIELMGDEAITEARALDALAVATEAALRSTDMSFMPLLPDENEDLQERLEQLGLWCSGFVAGFGLVSGGRDLDDEANELLEDLISISQIEADDDTSDPEEREKSAERDYVELVEFVKVAALILTAEPSPTSDDDPYNDGHDETEDYH